MKITKSEYETLAAFRHALRLFLHFSEEAALKAGLEPQQHQAMLAIKGFPGRDHVTVGELAERLRIRQHSATGLTNRLVAKGFIVRKKDASDHRQVYVTLTARGERVLAKLSVLHKKQLRHAGPKIQEVLQLLSEGARD